MALPPPPLNQLWACGGPGAEPLEAFIVPNLKPFDKVLKDVFMEKIEKKDMYFDNLSFTTKI